MIEVGRWSSVDEEELRNLHQSPAEKEMKRTQIDDEEDEEY